MISISFEISNSLIDFYFKKSLYPLREKKNLKKVTYHFNKMKVDILEIIMSNDLN